MQASVSMSALKVRPASERDYGAIAAIYNEAIAQGSITMDTQPYTAQSVQAIANNMTAKETLLVGELAGHVIGWGNVKRYSDRPGYRFCCETSVYLSFALAGRGYGALLLSALIARAQVAGYRHIVAKILAVNQRSIRFHQRFGFEIVGTQKAIGFINQTWHDVVIMQRLIHE
ncbi:MAG: N-acetyltransferase family protein [Cyanobacteria bacterium J06598_3]